MASPAGILSGVAPRIILSSIGWAEGCSYIATVSSSELANLIRESLLINDPDETIAAGLHGDPAKILRADRAASRVRQEVAFVTQEPGYHSHRILGAHFQVSREDAQLRPNAPNCSRAPESSPATIRLNKKRAS